MPEWLLSRFATAFSSDHRSCFDDCDEEREQYGACFSRDIHSPIAIRPKTGRSASDEISCASRNLRLHRSNRRHVELVKYVSCNAIVRLKLVNRHANIPGVNEGFALPQTSARQDGCVTAYAALTKAPSAEVIASIVKKVAEGLGRSRFISSADQDGAHERRRPT